MGYVKIAKSNLEIEKQNLKQETWGEQATNAKFLPDDIPQNVVQNFLQK